MMSYVTGEMLFKGWTGEALNKLVMNSSSVDIETNPTLIFGDQIATAQAIGALLWQGISGGIVSDVLEGIPYFNNEYVQLPIRFLHGFSLSFLILSLLGRFENL